MEHQWRMMPQMSKIKHHLFCFLSVYNEFMVITRLYILFFNLQIIARYVGVCIHKFQGGSVIRKLQ